MSQPSPEVVVVRDVGVPAADGVRLATDLYLPARDGAPLPGRHPALLHRTPYDKSEVERSLGYCRRFAERGYVAVIQDCRGTFASGGDVDFLVPEAQDGADTLAWIGRQDWSDGRVGSWGTSWSGWTQTAMAALGPAELSAMVVNMSGADAWQSSVRHGGALELRFLAWAFWHSASNTQERLTADPAVSPALNLGAPSFAAWLTRMPIRQGQTQLRLVPPYERWALRILTESDRTDYWDHPSLGPIRHLERFPDVPVLLVGGWYDSYTRATLQLYQGLAAAGGRAPVRVLMGPWSHGASTPGSQHAGDVDFGEAAALRDFRALHLGWFDAALRGGGPPEEAPGADAPVRIFVMGGGGGHRTAAGRLFHGGRWRDEPSWPPPRAVFTDYHLHGDGTLSPTPPAVDGGCTTYRFDPANPVPSIGGNTSSLSATDPLPPGVADPAYAPRTSRVHDVLPAGGFDQVEAERFFGCAPPYLPLGSRPDVLVFQTPPLDEPVEVTGPVEVRLWVSSSAADTDFTAKLIDVYPPSGWYPHGYALNLSDSIVRLRYRDERARAEPLPAGQVAEVTVTLYPTSNLFAAGHRIRLDVSSSNFPRFDVNPNTGEAIGRERRRAAADNTVHHHAAMPSRMVLPVVPGA